MSAFKDCTQGRGRWARLKTVLKDQPGHTARLCWKLENKTSGQILRQNVSTAQARIEWDERDSNADPAPAPEPSTDEPVDKDALV